MVAARWGMRLIGLVSTIILARLLTPSDYGVVAIAMLVVGFLETIAYTGVDLALLRPGADTREHYDAAWTIQIIQGQAIAVLLLLIAPIAAPFFTEPRAYAVMQVLALRPFVTSFTNIGVVAFRKELNFAKDFQFLIVSKLLSFVVVVTAAVILRSYWALVIGMTGASVVEVLLSYIIHPYRPRISFKRVRELWGFSQWLIISRVGSFFTRKADEFVIGRVLGTVPMGSYHVSSDIATLPNYELIMPLRRAMFPTLSKHADDPENLERMFMLSASAVAVMAFSMGFGLMAVAPELVPLVLGEKWRSAIELMRWLSLFGSFAAMVLCLEMLLWVHGKTHVSAVQTWLSLLLLVPAAYLGAINHGVEGVAVARFLVSTIDVPVMVYLTARTCSISQRRIYAAIWRPLVAALVMITALEAFPKDWGLLAGLIAKVGCGVLIYPATLLLLWRLSGMPEGIEAEVAGRLRKAR